MEPDQDRGLSQAREAPEPGVTILTGRVIAENLEPVAGVVIILIRDADRVAETVSDEQGFYEITDIEPGDYRMRITGTACCRERIIGVTLEAGEINETNVMLEFFTATDLQTPYIVEEEWTGFIACAFRVAVGNAANCDFDPNQDRFYTFEVDQGIRSIVFALDWEPGVHLSGDLTVYLHHGSSWVGNTYARPYGPPPLEYNVAPDEGESNPLITINETTELQFQIWAGGYDTENSVDVVYQQEFTMYYHMYYWQTAPESASALPG